MTNYITIAALAAALAACATQEPEYATCTLPITRDAGMGVRVEGCAAWEFGPTPSQKREFDARARGPAPAVQPANE